LPLEPTPDADPAAEAVDVAAAPGGAPEAAAAAPAQTEAVPAEELEASDRVMPEAQAYLATALLRGVVQHPRGTGRRARSLGHPLGGKTGTTNDQGDAWFVGFSPEVATGVWVGFDEKRVLGPGETGGRAALPIWIDYMEDALAERTARDFPVPDGIVFARVDPETGLLASSATDDPVFLPFLEGTEPTTQAGEAATAERRRRLRLDF
ncbi:MAG: penicillin-binding transpeptidase domain-containing protein, partial [Myxococcota bacterium]|nr:penicillin-binding transpeptidase domain-containing protein [Myxococcota bacterium]